MLKYAHAFTYDEECAMYFMYSLMNKMNVGVCIHIPNTCEFNYQSLHQNVIKNTANIISEVG